MYPVAVPPNVNVFIPAVEYVHVYVALFVFERVIVVPETPVPDKVPPAPQSTIKSP